MDLDWMSLSRGQLLALGLGAVLVFWMLGAYNRLVELRSAIGRAWQQVDELKQRRAAAVRPLVEALRAPMAGEQGALEAWLAALAGAQQAGEALRARPVSPARAAAAATAESALSASGSRVLALVDHHAGLRAEPAVAAHLAELREVDSRLPFARQLYNEATQAYNEALRLFPTNLLARVYRFGPAGRL